MLTMKLVSFNKIPSEAKEDVSLLAGVIDGQPTYIAAEYLNPRTDSTGNGLVRDISEGGMKFTTVLRDDIEPEDQLYVKIYMPDGEIEERLSAVRHVEEIHIGVEFIDKKIPQDGKANSISDKK